MNDGAVRISIIVPSFRRADTLERLVGSIAPQLEGRSDRELIVVDDASNDPAYPALAERHRGRLQLVTQPKNAGPSAARNAGARVARGEYLIFTDDDCVAPPYWLDWFDNIVTQNPDADLIGGHARPLPHVKRWTPTRWAPFQFLQLGIWYSDEIVVLCSSCHLAVRRRWYERIGGFREQMRWAEDRNLTYRLRRAGAVIVFAAVGLIDPKAWREIVCARHSLGCVPFLVTATPYRPTCLSPRSRSNSTPPVTTGAMSQRSTPSSPPVRRMPIPV